MPCPELLHFTRNHSQTADKNVVCCPSGSPRLNPKTSTKGVHEKRSPSPYSATWAGVKWTGNRKSARRKVSGKKSLQACANRSTGSESFVVSLLALNRCEQKKASFRPIVGVSESAAMTRHDAPAQRVMRHVEKERVCFSWKPQKTLLVVIQVIP